MTASINLQVVRDRAREIRENVHLKAVSEIVGQSV